MILCFQYFAGKVLEMLRLEGAQRAVRFLLESRKILNSKHLLDFRCQHCPQNLGSKVLTRKIFRLKDLAAAGTAEICVSRSAGDFPDRPRQNLDFKELIWWRSLPILAKS
jgi:hypothetical protein